MKRVPVRIAGFFKEVNRCYYTPLGYIVAQNFGLVHSGVLKEFEHGHLYHEGWTLFHIPTGLSMGLSFKRLKEGIEFAERISLVNIDWPCNDEKICYGWDVEDIREVGRGVITAEELHTRMMIEKITGEEGSERL